MRWWVALIIIIFFVLPVVVGLLGPESALGAWLFDVFLVCVVLGGAVLVVYLALKGRSGK